MASQVHDRVAGSVAAIRSLLDQSSEIDSICHHIEGRLARGGTVFTCGNGGSAAQAMHFCEELTGRYRSNRRPFPAVCLNADPCCLTCIANDYGFEFVFSRQIEGIARPTDVLIGMSTSGHSQNVVRAMKAAREKGMFVVGFLGGDGGPALALCDHAVVVGSRDTAHIQEAHQVVLHLILEHVETMEPAGAATSSLP